MVGAEVGNRGPGSKSRMFGPRHNGGRVRVSGLTEADVAGGEVGEERPRPDFTEPH